MRRRAAMAGALALCAAGAPAGDVNALVALFTDKARAQRLGRAYLAGLDEVPGAAALAAAIRRDLPGRAGLRSEVAALIRRDFADGRLANVDGWLLSRTEARLCALAALA